MTNPKTDRQKLIEIGNELELILRDMREYAPLVYPSGLLRSEVLRSLYRLIRLIDEHNEQETASTEPTEDRSTRRTTNG